LGGFWFYWQPFNKFNVWKMINNPNNHCSMLKKILFLLLLPASLIAQDTPEASNFKHEIGINATQLIKQVVGLSNTTPATLPYTLTYKYISGKKAFRFGIGASVARDKGESQPLNTPYQFYRPVPTYFNQTFADIRIGYEIQIPVEKRFVCYFGFDLVTAFDRENSFSVNVNDNLPSFYSYNRTTVDNSMFRIGGGPVAGFQFFISKRISLFTETPLYFTWSKGNLKTESITDSDFGQGQSITTINDINSTSATRLNITLPVTLYLAVRL
jgi:hypothetical protein